MEFFKTEKKIHPTKNVCVKICKSFSIKKFFIITFFRFSYTLTQKWNFTIDFLKF